MNENIENPEEVHALLQTAIDAAVRAAAIILKYRLAGVTTTLKSDHSPVTEADEAANRIICDALQATGIPILSEEGAEIPFANRQSWNQLWIVDPLDGTKAFVRGKDDFAINIALIEDGLPVLGIVAMPVRNAVLFGGPLLGGSFRLDNSSADSNIARATPLPRKRDGAYTVLVSSSNTNEDTAAFVQRLRDFHPDLRVWPVGSAVKFCLLAEGMADAYVRFSPCMEWDTAAGHALVKGVGFDLTDQETGEEMRYNRKRLLNNSFIVQRPPAR